MAYRIAPLPMSPSELQGYWAIQSYFKCKLFTSRYNVLGPSAIAKLRALCVRLSGTILVCLHTSRCSASKRKWSWQQGKTWGQTRRTVGNSVLWWFRQCGRCSNLLHAWLWVRWLLSNFRLHGFLVLLFRGFVLLYFNIHKHWFDTHNWLMRGQDWTGDGVSCLRLPCWVESKWHQLDKLCLVYPRKFSRKLDVLSLFEFAPIQILRPSSHY